MINDSHASGADLYYNRDRPSLRALIDPGANRVLDLGCGSGAFGRKLLETGAASEVVGVELFPSAAEEAARHYSKVITGDIEQMPLPYDGYFDYVVCGDILEHLRDPYTVVRKIPGWLKEGGTLICSVPNIRYWGVLAEMAFKGEWEYRDAGIMDRTHLRFFTRRSCARMLEQGGFDVESWRMFIGGRKFHWINSLTAGLLREFLGTQIIVRAIATRSARTSTRPGGDVLP